MMGFRRKERIDRAETDGRGRRREENLGITHSILSMRALLWVGAQAQLLQVVLFKAKQLERRRRRRRRTTGWRCNVLSLPIDKATPRN